jgi:KaiC/GvpD/RAD55 family RecA-like ATPase
MSIQQIVGKMEENHASGIVKGNGRINYYKTSIPLAGSSLHCSTRELYRSPLLHNQLVCKDGRTATGIFGLDKILGGGYPRGTTVLVSGSSGTGKTIFCSQFLHSGIKEQQEPGIFISLEERASDIFEQMLSLGWDLEEHVQNGKLIIIDAGFLKTRALSARRDVVESFDVDAFIQSICNASIKIGAKRVVIDSIPAMGLQSERASEFRMIFSRMSTFLLNLGLTCLITTECPEFPSISRYGIEEFVARGVIILSMKKESSELKRFLRVRKMRGIAHSMRNIPFEITEGGIVLYLPV